MHNPISKPSAAAFLLRSVSFVALVVLGVAPPSGSAYAAQYLNAQSIVAGGYHFCAIVNGGAQCWGYSYNGQLGDGLFKDSTSPVLVEGLQSGVTAISAGGYHTCAIVNGGVKCWGRNPDGQLGDGTTSDSGVPVPVQGLGSGVIAISAGEYHTCAIVTGGSVRCWGWNSNGQLGNNSVNPTGTGAPVTVSNIASGATALAAGGYHTCALVSGGVQCWGYNGYGELDDGSETDRYIPVAAGGLASGVTAISAGLLHSCALVTGGTIHCWGGNDNGQLGNGTITLTGTNPPVTVSNIASGATAISAGGYLTCAVVSGAAKCWGSNYYGELGDGTLSEHHVPATVNGLSANVVGIAAAALTACARTSVAGVSQTQCWGDNVDGQVGQGDALFRYVPAAVPAITSGATALAQGAQGQHTCAIVGGAAKCWGDNQYGELGDNTYLLRPTPISVSGLSSGVTAIATGYLHTCAVVSGAAKCWGDNYYGMIGDGTNTVRPTPVTVSGLTSGVTGVAAGYGHSCAIVGTGVQCWGTNSDGELGNGSTSPSSLPVSVGGLVGTPSAISVGVAHTCVVLTSGKIQCWGYNSNGQLGNNSTTSTLTNAPVLVSNITSGATAVAAGDYFTCAIVSGAAKCWGDGQVGRLGNNDVADSHVPVGVTGLTANVATITAGGGQACATVSGAASCWGVGYYGELGNGASAARKTPVAVTGLGANVSTIAAAFTHTCAIVGGAVQCWGGDYFGQLGVNRPVYLLLPGIVVISNEIFQNGFEPLN